MQKWILAAITLVPALALATPLTFAPLSGKVATSKGKPGGGSQGAATAADVTFGGKAATDLVYSGGLNPQQRGDGNPGGFSAAFIGSGTGTWSGFAKFSGASNTSVHTTLDGLALTMGFSLADSRHGSWAISNRGTASLSLDLVFAMHTGGGSGAWLFDNVVLGAGSTVQGQWLLNLLNHGGKLADYSNLTLFARDAAALPFADGPAATTSARPDGASAPLAASGDIPARTDPALDMALPQLIGALARPDVLPATAATFDGAHLQADATNPAEVSEPASAALFLGGLALAAASRRRRTAGAGTA